MQLHGKVKLNCWVLRSAQTNVLFQPWGTTQLTFPSKNSVWIQRHNLFRVSSYFRKVQQQWKTLFYILSTLIHRLPHLQYIESPPRVINNHSPTTTTKLHILPIFPATSYYKATLILHLSKGEFIVAGKREFKKLTVLKLNLEIL